MSWEKETDGEVGCKSDPHSLYIDKTEEIKQTAKVRARESIIKWIKTKSGVLKVFRPYKVHRIHENSHGKDKETTQTIQINMKNKNLENMRNK